MGYQLRILHMSDLHILGAREKEPWRRRRVLGDAWKKNLDDLLEEGAVDLVAFTGDLAFSGRADEYEGVTEFALTTLEHLKLGRDRLFVVPGNHDVDRSRSVSAWAGLRSLLRPEDALELSRWMASEGSQPPRGFHSSHRDELFGRQEAYREWVHKTLERPELLPSPTLHPRLGYRAVLRLPGQPFDVNIIGLDSAWLAGDGHDAGKLWLTDDQVMRLATDDRGGKLLGFRLALIHHPLEQLMDHAQARRLLAEHVDLLLRGHLHEPEAELSAAPSHALRSLAAGCLYEHDRYPNSCQLIQLTLDERGRPQGHEVRFRSWSSHGHWFDNDGLYPGTRGGRLRWGRLPATEAPVSRPRGGRTFVGREEHLRAMAEALLPGTGERRTVALQGMPGVGKSYLMDRFATLHEDRFPGGYIRLVLEPEERRTGVTLLQVLADRFGLNAGQQHLVSGVRDRLMTPLSLLSIDNVDTPLAATSVAEVVRLLEGCAVIVAGRLQDIGMSAGWQLVKVHPLDEPTALEQLSREHHPPRDGRERADFGHLLEKLGGLPLAIHLAAGYLRKGRTVNGFLEHLRRKRLALEPGDRADPLLVEDRSRAILRSSFELSLGVLRDLLRDEWGEEAERFLQGLAALGFVPASGVGRSLAAAITGLSEDDFGHLVALAVELSVVTKVPEEERPHQDAWRVHPLLAELLQEGARLETVLARMTEWFIVRFPLLSPGLAAEQGQRWKEVQDEDAALQVWLTQVPGKDMPRVERAGSDFAQCTGPFHAWIAFCERMLTQVHAPDARANAMGTLASVAVRAGLFERALEVAREKRDLDRARQDEFEEAIVTGTIADILEARGEPDEALRLLREEVLPVYERLGRTRSRAVALGRIARLLYDRGEVNEAFQLWQQLLPTLKHQGYLREHAVILSQFADALRDKGQVTEALQIFREEVLPTFDFLGEVQQRAAALLKIASLLMHRDELDEALRLLREALSVFERLKDSGSCAVASHHIAEILLTRGELAEALRLLREEVLPVLERLGDTESCVATLMYIARIFELRRDQDEALRLWREEIFPRVQSGRSRFLRAVALGKIADWHRAQGDQEEALRLWRDEVLPVLETQQDFRWIATARWRIADLLVARGERAQALRLLRDEVLPLLLTSNWNPSLLTTVQERVAALSRQSGQSETES